MYPLHTGDSYFYRIFDSNRPLGLFSVKARGQQIVESVAKRIFLLRLSILY